MSRRTRFALAAMGMVVVLVPSTAAAQAGSRQTFKAFFDTPELGRSTAIRTQLLYRNPGRPDAKPIAVRRERFTFPEATHFDPAVVPACNATDEDLRQHGAAACASGTRTLNGGGTVMSGFPLVGETETRHEGFENGTGLTLLATVPMFGLRVVTRAVREGRTLTATIPRAPFGGPPDGESPLRRVDNIGVARELGDRAYVRTPEVCPRSGHWTFTGEFTYADGVTQSATHLMPCNRDTIAPRIHVAGVPRKRCVRRAFRARVAIADGSRLRRAHLRLNGRLIRATRRSRFSAQVAVSRLRAGRNRLSVTARDLSGNRGRRIVGFRRCRG